MFAFTKAQKEKRLFYKLLDQYDKMIQDQPHREEYPTEEVYDLAMETWGILMDSIKTNLQAFYTIPITEDTYYRNIDRPNIPLTIYIDLDSTSSISPYKYDSRITSDETREYEWVLKKYKAARISPIIRQAMSVKFHRTTVRKIRETSCLLFNRAGLIENIIGNSITEQIDFANFVSSIRSTTIDMSISRTTYLQYEEYFEYYKQKTGNSVIIDIRITK